MIWCFLHTFFVTFYCCCYFFVLFSPTGPAEAGLPGAGGSPHHGLCAADDCSGGGRPLEGAGGQTGQSLQAADGGVRGPSSRQERSGGQRGRTPFKFFYVMHFNKYN